jgi:hypothetical protein
MLTTRQTITAAAPGLVLAALVLIAAIVALSLPATSQAEGAIPPSPAKGSTVTMSLDAPECYEDQPCWNWATMGNLQRGVYVRNTAKARAVGVNPSKQRALRLWRVVTPCEFAYASHEGLLDTRKTKRLRGDLFAQRHGCDYRLYA